VSNNVRITAVRKLAVKRADNGLPAPEIASGITRVKGVATERRLGTRHDLVHAPNDGMKLRTATVNVDREDGIPSVSGACKLWCWSMLRVLSAAILLAMTATAGEFEFSDFANTKDLFLVRDAHRRKHALRLTDSANFEVGAAWYREKQQVAGGFETTFTFRLTAQGGGGRGADGLAFVVQNDHRGAIGGYGASAGFMRSDAGAPGAFQSGIVRRLAVFFDTFQNRWDTSGNHVAICGCGKVVDLRWPPHCMSYSEMLPVNLKDGEVHTVRILYDPPRMAVYLDDIAEPVREGSVDLLSIVGGEGMAWVGFTAATGGSFENHDVLSWKFGRLKGRAESAGSTVDSAISMVDSAVSFAPAACLPGRKLCTPEEAVVQDKGSGLYHVYLPANLEWGASVPNPAGAPVKVTNVTGIVCWEPSLHSAVGCNGPEGNGIIPGKDVEGGADFVAPQRPVGSLLARQLNRRVWFTINDRTGEGFKDNQGFFEFDVRVEK
jgi:hypothetical protein